MLRDSAAVLLIAGLLLALDAAATLIWQEPVTAVIAAIDRSEIDQRVLTIPLTGLDRRALASLTTPQERIAFLARREARELTTGGAVGRISIARIGVSFEIVQGTDSATLREGPGHYAQTALPGQGETVAIAGHRTTFLAPFRDINRLVRGDQIDVSMPYGRFVYVVQGQRIVAPTTVSVLNDRGYDRLVLSACNPLYSAAQRIIVFARLRRVVPSPEATANPGASSALA